MPLTPSYWVHQLSPVALDLKFISIHWYGLMYMIGFMCFYFLGCQRAKQPYFSTQGWTPTWVEDFLSYGILGVILGGRLGYVLFYKPAHFLAHPQEILQIWHGGMSFHGGLIGVLIAGFIFSKKTKRTFLEIMDFVAPLIPTGLGAGRIGNFINGELWGRPTDVAWAVIFPQVDKLPRHPSQLYEFIGEGLLLFGMLWLASKSPIVYRKKGRISALFLIGYAIARMTVECFREPDRFLSPLAAGLTMGQWLCIPMILLGIALWIRAKENDIENKHIPTEKHSFTGS